MAQPSKVKRASTWSDDVEEGTHLPVLLFFTIANLNYCSCRKFYAHVVIIIIIIMYLFPAYRFQLAGYRDEQEYLAVTKLDTVSSETLNHLCRFTSSSHVLNRLILSRWSGGHTTIM